MKWLISILALSFVLLVSSCGRWRGDVPKKPELKPIMRPEPRPLLKPRPRANKPSKKVVSVKKPVRSSSLPQGEGSKKAEITIGEVEVENLDSINTKQ